MFLPGQQKIFVFDVEGNNLFPAVTKIHCLVIEDYWTAEVFRYGPDDLEAGVKKLQEAAVLVGHNIIDYDIRAIKKIFPWFIFTGILFDTLILSRLIYSNLREMDYKICGKGGYIPEEKFVIWDKKNKCWKSAIGSHSLEAWGLRLKEKKGDFHQDTDWQQYTPEMLDYCQQDVRVNAALLKRMLGRNYSQDAINLELEVAKILTEQNSVGWEFDTKYAQNVYVDLLDKKHALIRELQETLPGWYENMKTPEYYFIEMKDMLGDVIYKHTTKKAVEDEVYGVLKPAGYTRKEIKDLIQDGPIKRRHTPFNPGSHHHTARVLIETYGWKPTLKNDDGSWKTSTDILESLDYPIAKKFIEYEVIQDRLEKIKEGKNGGYLDYVDEKNRLRHYVNQLGTNTHRATHSTPNVAQVPAVIDRKGKPQPWGKEFRSFFKAKEGYILVDTDASQQEMCCQGHYMAKFDEGAFSKAVAEGKKEEGTDPHTLNMKAARLDSRENAKTFYYAMVYGAGDEKLGKITGKNGKQLRAQFLDSLPALKTVVEACKTAARVQGYLIGLDGRLIYTRKEHSAFNALLQSCGAILTKRWMVIIDRKLREKGIKEWVHQVGWIHDELAFEVIGGLENQVKYICIEAMEEVEKYYSFRCPLKADAHIGSNWSEVH